MSDVHSAPVTPSIPPSAPSAPSAEVPVSSPVDSPTPLGSQAPPKPPGQESNKSSHIGRREAIQNAFARSKAAQDEAGKAQPERRAQAPTQREGGRGPQDKKPTESAQPGQNQTRLRGEHGHFASDPNKPQVAVAQQGQEQTPPGQQRQQYQPLDQNAPFRDPPSRFSEQARTEWAGAPESVRGAVHQMAREFKGIYDKYRGDYEVMETLRPYHDLAVKQGTTLEKAFTNYYQMEQKLRSDIIGGLDVIVRNLGMRHNDGTQVSLRDVAWHIMNMTPEQHRLSAQANQQNASDMRIGQLHQMVDKLAHGIEQMQYQQRFRDTRAEVDDFAKKHPRLDELGAAIKQELDHGYSLPVAYRRAELLHPPTQAAQTRNTSAQTRRTSISGAPDGGNGRVANTRPSDGQRRQNGEAKYPTRREAIAKAIRRASNGL